MLIMLIIILFKFNCSFSPRRKDRDCPAYLGVAEEESGRTDHQLERGNITSVRGRGVLF